MNKRKRILHLITGLELGGTENMLLKTLPLIQDKFENIVCCIVGTGPVGEKLVEKGVTVHYLKLKNIFDVGAIIRFGKVISQVKPDLLVTYLIHADLWGRIWGKAFGVKKVICSQRGSLLQWQWLRIVDKLTKHMVDMYTTQTEIAKINLVKELNIDPDKVMVIPNFVSVKENKKINRSQKLHKLGIMSNKLNFICVSKLRRGKGHECLLEAFENLFRSFNNINLLLVGDGDRKEELINQVKGYNSRDSIFFLGKREDVTDLLLCSDFFVLPTEGEGMSNAILEAMEAGIPVIVSNIQENLELLPGDDYAVFVWAKDTKSLERGMDYCIRNNKICKSKAIRAMERVLDDYSENRIIPKLYELYKTIIED